jgi:hypothetical protein
VGGDEKNRMNRQGAKSKGPGRDSGILFFSPSGLGALGALAVKLLFLLHSILTK